MKALPAEGRFCQLRAWPQCFAEDPWFPTITSRRFSLTRRKGDGSPTSSPAGPSMLTEAAVAGDVSPMRRMSLLASIVNSSHYRKPDADPESFRKATEQLGAMGEEFSVDGARLAHVRHLGEGAFATVDLYKLKPKASESLLSDSPGGKAAEKEGTVLVAVKTMKELVPGPPDPRDPEQKPTLQPAPASWKAEFYAEAALLVGLRHENVVRSLGTAKKKDGQMMLIQEFMAGGSLGDQLRRPRYSGLQSLRWMRDLACGMEYLHTALDIPIAHRDLKPANVLLDKNGVAKVADLGLFRMLANHGRDTLAKLESERASAAAADGEMSEARDAAPGMRRLSTLSPTAEEMADGGPDSNTSEKEGGRRASRRVEGPGERRARSPRSPSTHPLPPPTTTLRSLHHSSAKPGKTYTSSPDPPRHRASTPTPPPSRLTPLAPPLLPLQALVGPGQARIARPPPPLRRGDPSRPSRLRIGRRRAQRRRPRRRHQRRRRRQRHRALQIAARRLADDQVALLLAQALAGRAAALAVGGGAVGLVVGHLVPRDPLARLEVPLAVVQRGRPRRRAPRVGDLRERAVELARAPQRHRRRLRLRAAAGEARGARPDGADGECAVHGARGAPRRAVQSEGRRVLVWDRRVGDVHAEPRVRANVHVL